MHIGNKSDELLLLFTVYLENKYYTLVKAVSYISTEYFVPVEQKLYAGLYMHDTWHMHRHSRISLFGGKGASFGWAGKDRKLKTL